MTPGLEHTLRDGRVVHIRAMRPSDEAELLQAFERMSSEARYMRLMHVVREPNRERLREQLASFPAEAKRRGVKEMEGYVLSENAPMLRLARKLGFSTKYMPDDAAVRICTLALA
jgi:hypothetical protein